MTEVQAAVGRVGLRRLTAWLNVRRRNAHIFAQRLVGVRGIRVPRYPEGHAHYVFYSYIRPDEMRDGWTRDRVLGELVKLKVECSVGVCGELYLERAFTNAALGPPERFPTARELGETSLAFAVHPLLTEADMHDAADKVCEVLGKATV